MRLQVLIRDQDDPHAFGTRLVTIADIPRVPLVGERIDLDDQVLIVERVETQLRTGKISIAVSPDGHRW